MLVEFGKYLFEHFAWGQTLLYYNRMSMVTKYHILRKAWEAQLAMLATGKKCWVGFMKKMATQASALRGGKFSSFGSTIT